MTRLINLEGIDCCGKSTLSKMLTARLNNESAGPGTGEWNCEHEPRFSSTEADAINIKDIDPWQREYYFMKDRIGHQDRLQSFNTILDRYILSGLAYAQTFSPSVVTMMKSIYSIVNEFKRPDVIVFIDIEPANAITFNELKKGTDEYSRDLNINTLQTIRNNFKLHFQTMREWEIPVTIVQPIIGDLALTLDAIVNKIHPYL